MNMKSGERQKYPKSYNADDVLTSEDLEEIESILFDFAELPLEELKEHEQDIKIKKAKEYLGSSVSVNEIDPGNCNIAERVKRNFDRVDNEPESIETQVESKDANYEDFMTTDLFTKEDIKAYERKHNKFFGEKVFKNFFNLKLNDPYSYYPKDKVYADLEFMENMKKERAFDESSEEDKERVGHRFENFFPAGIVLNNWLGRASNMKPNGVPKVGLVKHTLEYDDVVNHVDYYTQLEIDGEKIAVGFDTTANSSEDKLLAKLESSSSEDYGISKMPFGFTRIKYSVIDGKIGATVPLFKIALNYDRSFRIADNVDAYGKEETKQSLDILESANNKHLLSEDEHKKVEKILEKPEGAISKEEKMFLNVVNIRADNFFNLRNAFFVSSEMFEQCELILKKEEKIRTKKVHARNGMTDEEVSDVEKIRDKMWSSLKLTMRGLVAMNGAREDLKGMDDKGLYRVLQECAGVFDEGDEERKEHYFGLRLFKGEQVFRDRCYVNLIKAIKLEKGEAKKDGKNEVMYKRYETAQRNGKDVVVTKIGKFREELSNSENPKETARQIFSKITPESYMDNFEELIEIAQETETLKIFLDRMRMGEFDREKGILEGGYEKNVGGEFVRTEKSEGANYDEFIEGLFEDDEFLELRKKYLQGSNKDRLADCLSEGFLKKEENIIKLISWGVSDGRIASIIARLNNVPIDVAKDKLSLLKASRKS